MRALISMLPRAFSGIFAGAGMATRSGIGVALTRHPGARVNPRGKPEDGVKPALRVRENSRSADDSSSTTTRLRATAGGRRSVPARGGAGVRAAREAGARCSPTCRRWASAARSRSARCGSDRKRAGADEELEGAALRERRWLRNSAWIWTSAPTMVTLRGWRDERDGHIHCDSTAKRVTVLLYLNPATRRLGAARRLSAAAARSRQYGRLRRSKCRR